MKALKKLALVSAVSMISAGAFAMEAMDDESLSAATGQDGITIFVSPGTKTGTQLGAMGVTQGTMDAIDVGGVADNNVVGVDLNSDGDFVDAGETAPAFGTSAAFKGLSVTQVIVHDDDGFTVAQGGSAATTNSGAIVIGDGTAADSTVVFADDTQPIQIDIDAVGDHNGAAAGGGAMLNVKITTPTLAIKQGAVYVANSDSAADDIDADGVAAVDAGTADTDGTTATGLIKIMNGMEIVLGSTVINIQLGNEAQGAAIGGAMIAVNASIVGGLTINNLETLDQGGVLGGGAIRASSLVLKDTAGGANLTAGVFVNVEDSLAALSPFFAGDTSGGLIVTLAQLGTLAGGVDLTLNDQALGSATAADLGDVQVIGLNLNGSSLIIRGH